jgi:hypothetical protein
MRRLTPLLATMALGLGLAGCVPDQPTPTPTPTVEPASPTPTPTPTPQWDAEQQAAIDAVQTYLDRWTDIAQNLPDADFTRIFEVAGDTAGNEAAATLSEWKSAEYHLVGAPVFTPEIVIPGMTDELGQRHNVHGCLDTSSAYLVDKSGARVVPPGGPTTAVVNYTIILRDNGGSGVLKEESEGEQC